MIRPSQYVCEVRKFKGKKLCECKDYELLQYMDWIRREIINKGNKLWPEMEEFLEMAKRYLEEPNDPNHK